MTREEAIEALKKVCVAFDRSRLENIAVRDQSRQMTEAFRHELELKDREHKDTELALSNADNRTLRQTVEKKDAEIKDLKSRLADSRHSVGSLRQEKFAGRSKRGLGKTKTTSKGRDDDKDDFGGTPGPASQTAVIQGRTDYPCLLPGVLAVD